MTTDIWLTFVVTASVILVVPGPTIIYVIAQSLSHGQKSAVPLSAGVVLGDAACLFFSVLGLGAMLALSSTLYTAVRLAGAAYLIYLGISLLRFGMQATDIHSDEAPFKAGLMFRNVFTITALNPKGIIFFSAFVPQFVDPAGDVVYQFSVLGATFLTLALFNTLCYSLLAGQFAALFRSRLATRWLNGTGGVVLVGAGVAAATYEK